MQGNLGVAHLLGDVGERAADDLLVGPANAVSHGNRRIGGIAGLLQLVGDAEHPGHAEENYQRAAVPRQADQVLAFRHGNPPLGAGQDHRLRDFRHGQLGLEHGGGGKGGADAGDDLVVNPFRFHDAHLLQRRAVQGRVAALNAGDGLALSHGLQGDVHDLRQSHLLAAVHPGARFGEPGDLRRHQRVGVDNHVRVVNDALRLQRQELRIPRPRADDIDLAVVRHVVAPLADIRNDLSGTVNCPHPAVSIVP